MSNGQPSAATSPYSAKARAFLHATIAIGATCLWIDLQPFYFSEPTRFLTYFVMAALAAGLRLSVPTFTGTLSINFLFILIGLVHLTRSELVILGGVSAVIQCLAVLRSASPDRSPTKTKILFNLSVTVIAIHIAELIFRAMPAGPTMANETLRLAPAALALFLLHTVPVAIAIAWTEGRRVIVTWRECSLWSLPYSLAGAGVAATFSSLSQQIGWQLSLLLLPVVYLITRSYQLHIARVEDGLRHAEELASLHLRTIEALALAIEAKDSTTANHLERVQTYATEIGRMMKISADELSALRAAALLHDIGKLAVPEHILSKPGRLSPDEFEKMKIHPIVGADIIERANFPYPVAPIVRSHHERWDGGGYPDGLRGEAIPIGARILSAVDCFDALNSDRQYRRAIAPAEAIAFVKGEAGRAFDPAVVQLLVANYPALERTVKANAGRIKDLTSLRITRGKPAAGFEPAAASSGEAASNSLDFLEKIASARLEVLTLFELTNDLGSSLSLQETLSVLATRLKRLVPFDSLAIYFLRDGKLIPEYVTGENFRLFSSLQIPFGHGLSGWVAERRQPILNGNPSVEPGYLNDPEKFSTLRSALAVPLEGAQGVVGVLSLYHAEKDAFSRDHLRILNGISAKLSNSIENALRFHVAETTATTDYLTGLPNARSLFPRLEEELSRCRRSEMPLEVLVCDLNGFKQVNDRFGHLEGNRVLREVATRLRENCREYDFVARMGGDEFVIVMPEMEAGNFQIRAAQLSQLAADAGRMITGENILSCAVGNARFPEDGADSEQLLSIADQRMYRNKYASRELPREASAEPDHDGWPQASTPSSNRART